MRRTFPIAILVAALTGGALMQAQAPRGAELQFKAAQQKEEVEGDLKGAIEQYKKLAQSSDRSFAARALVRMAGCYQKLGDVEAQKIYGRILREYADQSDAVAIARARLNVDSHAAASRTTVFRKLWTSPMVTGEASLSRDGRFVAYPDWDTGNLALHDLVAGTDRHLTNQQIPRWTEYAEVSTFSPDGARIAYGWFNGTDRYVLRVLGTKAAASQPQQIFDNSEVEWIAPYDWSPDGKWIAVELQRKDRTAQIALVSPADGVLRVLKSIDWRGTNRIFFSPDSRYVAYDMSVSDTDSNERDVFVLAADGGRETAIVAHPGHDRVMGWSPDGTRLLFASDRVGGLSLWHVPVADGRAQGAAVQIKKDIDAWSIGVTSSGALYVAGGTSISDVRVGSIDLATGLATAPASSVVRNQGWRNFAPDWSPDGKYLAYTSRDPRGRNRMILVRTIETGDLRELPVALDYFGPTRWMPDGGAFLAKGKDLKGREGVYKIDARTGAIELLVAVTGTGNNVPQISPDGTKLYYWAGGPFASNPRSSFMERDLRTGRDREILHAAEGPGWPMLSPDGRYLAGNVAVEGASTALVLIDVASGERKQLLRMTAPDSLVLNGAGIAWTPKGSVIVTVSHDPKSPWFQSERLIVPVNGGTPRKLDLGVPRFWGPISVHPDGRRIAFGVEDNKPELWVLENFLATATAVK